LRQRPGSPSHAWLSSLSPSTHDLTACSKLLAPFAHNRLLWARASAVSRPAAAARSSSDVLSCGPGRKQGRGRTRLEQAAGGTARLGGSRQARARAELAGPRSSRRLHAHVRWQSVSASAATAAAAVARSVQAPGRQLWGRRLWPRRRREAAAAAAAHRLPSPLTAPPTFTNFSCSFQASAWATGQLRSSGLRPSTTLAARRSAATRVASEWEPRPTVRAAMAIDSGAADPRERPIRRDRWASSSSTPTRVDCRSVRAAGRPGRDKYQRGGAAPRAVRVQRCCRACRALPCHESGAGAPLACSCPGLGSMLEGH